MTKSRGTLVGSVMSTTLDDQDAEGNASPLRDRSITGTQPITHLDASIRMLQPDGDGLQPHAADETADRNGHQASEPASHFADPSGGLSSAGMNSVASHTSSHMYSEREVEASVQGI